MPYMKRAGDFLPSQKIVRNDKKKSFLKRGASVRDDVAQRDKI